MKNRPLLEVCVDSPAGLMAAVEGGADRIELCAALSLSGLTPSPGLMALAATTPCPIHTMVRPRAGDFRYGPAEIELMRRDIDAVRDAGLAGVVFGATRPNDELDAKTLEALIRQAEGLSVTLHRAFDLAPDIEGALHTAVELGFNRVLTSGGAPSAVEGAEQIADLVAQAVDRIIVMAGAGLNPRNIAAFARQTGVQEVHASCSGPAPSNIERSVLDGRALSLGFSPPGLKTTQPALVADMIEALNHIG